MGETEDVPKKLNYSSVEEALWAVYTAMSMRTNDEYWWEFIDNEDVKDTTELLTMAIDYMIENLKELFSGRAIYDVVAFIISISKEYDIYDRIMSILNEKGGSDGTSTGKNCKNTKK